MYLPKLPKGCVYVDLETTGFSFENHRILQVGVRLVPDVSQLSPPEDAVDLLLKTPYDPYIWGAVYLQEDFITRTGDWWTPDVRQAIDANNGSCAGVAQVPAEIRDEVNKNGRRKFMNAFDVHGISASRTLEQGVDREAGLRQVHALLQDSCNSGMQLVGHNLIGFDIRFLGEEFARIGLSFPYEAEQVMDTGLLVKADQLGMVPEGNEGMGNFYARVKKTFARVKWSLDGYCVEKFGLTKYGVDTAGSHRSAAYDTFVNQCLVHHLYSAAA
jgi:DNA polymerase III epsilon subunit-like protein